MPPDASSSLPVLSLGECPHAIAVSTDFTGQPPHRSSAPSHNTQHTSPCSYVRIDHVYLNTITHRQKEEDQHNKKVCFLSHISSLVHRRRFSRCSRQRCSSFPPRRPCLIVPRLSLSNLDSLIIDEADLILSYGHDVDIRAIFAGNFLPKVYQSFLMCATMAEDVGTLKGLALRSPVCLFNPNPWKFGVDRPV